MRSRILVLSLMLLAAACGGTDTATTAAAGGTAAPNTDAPGTTAEAAPLAPDFTTVLSDGSEFTLGDHDKPVYLVFWAEW